MCLTETFQRVDNLLLVCSYHVSSRLPLSLKSADWESWRAVGLTDLWAVILHRNLLIWVDWGNPPLSPTVEDIHGTTVADADTPLTITAPGEVAEGESFVLWSLDDFVRFYRAKRIGYASVPRLFFESLLFGLGVARASADSR